MWDQTYVRLVGTKWIELWKRIKLELGGGSPSVSQQDHICCFDLQKSLSFLTAGLHSLFLNPPPQKKG